MIFPDLMEHFYKVHVEPIIWAMLLMMIGFLVARLVSTSLVKSMIKHLTPQQSMLLKRIVFYLIVALFAASAVQELGFQIGAFLGAAGILTVAIGIASQTSMSNIISGVFMIGEKPFEVGHTVRVGDTQGEILSIDLLSVKIRTPDNTMVRIPNETLIKSSIINLSSFPIRRIDLKIGVAYKEDLERVKQVLFDVAYKNPLSLIEPKPSFLILGFGESAVDLQFSVWGSRPHFYELKNTIQVEIKKAFEEMGIEMPFPSRTLYTSAGINVLPTKLTSS